LQAIAQDIWHRNGILGAVCHGPVLLPAIIDRKTGRSIVEVKRNWIHHWHKSSQRS